MKYMLTVWWLYWMYYNVPKVYHAWFYFRLVSGYFQKPKQLEHVYEYDGTWVVLDETGEEMHPGWRNIYDGYVE
jgi:hypothetical protein